MFTINKKSKLVITIGPASENYEVMKSLILAGATCVRGNFSHGTHEEQKAKFDIAKQISKELNIPISLMLDTKGPEIRIGKMKDGGQQIQANTILKVHTTSEAYSKLEGTHNEITVSYDMSQDLKVGDIVLFDDGKLTSHVINVESGLVEVKTFNNHYLKTNKRINLPGVDFSLPFLSEKDKNDILFGIKEKIDYVAASFVNSAQNVKELRTLLNENNGKNIGIIAKIESQLGVNNIDEIIEEVDGIMVARGDLGLEIPYYEVPVVQKMIIEKCRKAGKYVIVATQMLDSMENNPHPTRAEVTDVYHATELGADSTMLSGESASGKYPELAVKTMSTINKRAEEEFYQIDNYEKEFNKASKSNCNCEFTQKLAHDLALKIKNNNYKYLVLVTQYPEIIKELTKYRPNTIIIPVLDKNELTTKYGVVYGVWPILNSEELFSKVKNNINNVKELFNTFKLELNDKILIYQDNQELLEW
ncbi:pyruvate kinase [Mycoplasma sp. 1018B]|uniref:pyruvate kinase n=1 Tax=Mycoplasma sp. 1018B TaxID=2967302 RepID=UPI00211CBD06|nr:pyruvate kinase [Mycoplasma sp. 1018B]UUM19219.1 pyruvate kinase [Mycoplasma sp. 1018B]